MATNLFTNSVKIIILMLFSLYLTACVPLHNIFFDNGATHYDNQMIIPFIMPFIDFQTQQGFYINLANQIMICLIGVIIVPSVELVNCVMMNNVSVLAAVIENKLAEFGGAIKREDQLSAEHMQRFRNIIVQIMDYDRFFSNSFDLIG